MVTATDPPTSADVPEGDREAAQAVLLVLSLVACGVAAEVGWVLGHQPSLPLGDLSLTDTLSGFAGQWPGLLQQLVGLFGGADGPLPLEIPAE